MWGRIAHLCFLGSSQEKTFGPTISGLIKKNIEPERLMLWDSKERGGRPDTMKLIREAYYSFGAEGGIFSLGNPLDSI
jgi:hypothetical protein